MHHNVGIIFSHQTVLSLHAGLRQLNKDMILQYDRQKFLIGKELNRHGIQM